jgi:Fic family protein
MRAEAAAVPSMPRAFAELIADADDSYVPIDGFDEWASIEVSPAFLPSYDTRREELWSKWTGELLRLRDDSRIAYAKALAVVLRCAAIETGAVENLYELRRGATISVATEEADWETVLESSGVGARSHFEDQLRTYERVLSDADADGAVTEVWIRQLHEMITASQDQYVAYTAVGPQPRPLLKGAYKEYPNHVVTRDGSVHAYCPISDVQPEMAKFVNQLRTETFQNAHPLLRAVYAHWALTHIHPFADGNGRVARALSSFFLLQAAGCPFLVYSDRKLPYFQALEHADDGDRRALVDYFLDRTLDSVAWVIDLIQDAARAPLESSIQRLADLVQSQGENTIEALDSIAIRIETRLREYFESTIDASTLPGGVTYSVSDGQHDPCPESWRRVEGCHGIRVRLATTQAVSLEVEGDYGVCTTYDVGARFAFIVGSYRPPQLLLRFDDVQPTLGTNAEFRLQEFARRSVDALVSRLTRDTEEVLRKAGTLR